MSAESRLSTVRGIALPVVTVAIFVGCGPSETTASTTGETGGAAGATSTVTSGTGGLSTGGSGGASGGPWHSALYPPDWNSTFEDAEGHFLHDFSYAGFEYGAPPLAEDLPIFAVSAGLDPTGMADSTQALQNAIGEAETAGGGIVHLPMGLFRVDGQLVIHSSHVVLQGEGAQQTQLYFTKTQGISDTAHILFDGQVTYPTETLLAANGEARQTTLQVEDASGFTPGDDVDIGFVISPEFIEEHGMTGTWQAFNGTWQTFFRRTVIDVNTAVSPAVLTVDVPLRYTLKTRDSASVRRVSGMIDHVGVESLGVANAASWEEAWAQTRSHVIEMAHVRDGYIKNVESFVSPQAPTSGDGAGAHLLSGGILVRESKRVTVDHVTLGLPQHRGPGGNGYLFEVQRSSEVLTVDSVAKNGRHNFIQNWGFGTTGCVLLRVESSGGKAYADQNSTGFTSLGEYHHSLATANLVDSSTFDDGFSTINRNGESTGAGHTGTQNVFWNVRGKGMLRSMQFGVGYIIGTQDLSVVTESPLPMFTGTEPVDYVEGQNQGADLEPSSLYENQRSKRLMLK
ncbi:MAG: hypothetical protein IPK82_25880 [Polyangiaceae bacterium]|nr:hypothetical protein [Polyangiaceae bacterium]